MLVSDPSSPLPLSFVPLLPPAADFPGTIAGVGRMGQMSSAWMKKREFVTPEQTVATVAIKMATNVFHGNVA